MESFIVKIYRQEKSCSEKVIGIAQNVFSSEEVVFTNAEELWKFINKKKENGKKNPVT